MLQSPHRHLTNLRRLTGDVPGSGDALRGIQKLHRRLRQPRRRPPGPPAAPLPAPTSPTPGASPATSPASAAPSGASTSSKACTWTSPTPGASPATSPASAAPSGASRAPEPAPGPHQLQGPHRRPRRLRRHPPGHPEAPGPAPEPRQLRGPHSRPRRPRRRPPEPPRSYRACTWTAPTTGASPATSPAPAAPSGASRRSTAGTGTSPTAGAHRRPRRPRRRPPELRKLRSLHRDLPGCGGLTGDLAGVLRAALRGLPDLRKLRNRTSRGIAARTARRLCWSGAGSPRSSTAAGRRLLERQERGENLAPLGHPWGLRPFKTKNDPKVLREVSQELKSPQTHDFESASAFDAWPRTAPCAFNVSG